MNAKALLIEASAGFNQGAGIGRYAREILRASLPSLDSHFDLRLWYAADGGATPAFHDAMLDVIPPSARNRIVRSKFSRRRIDQIGRLPVSLPARLLAGKCDVAYSPDFTLPGNRAAGGMITVHDLAFGGIL